jgi:hypothetical protein
MWLKVRIMDLFLPITIIAALAVQADPSVPVEQQESYVLFTVATSPEKCNDRLATKVDLQTLANDPAKWVGKCIAVHGYWRYRALFANPKDTRTRYAESNGALKARRVGIYGTERLLASAPRSPTHYTAIGIAGQCETLGQGALMVMGYCHYTDGPYIAVSFMRQR